jgi:hypothetical protein
MLNLLLIQCVLLDSEKLFVKVFAQSVEFGLFDLELSFQVVYLFLQGPSLHFPQLQLVNVFDFLFLPLLYFVLQPADVGSFPLGGLVVGHVLRIRVIALGVIVLRSLKLLDFVLSLHGDFADLLQLLTVKFTFLFVLFEGVAVLLKFLFVFVDFLCELVLQLFDFLLGDEVFQRRA